MPKIEGKKIINKNKNTTSWGGNQNLKNKIPEDFFISEFGFFAFLFLWCLIFSEIFPHHF